MPNGTHSESRTQGAASIAAQAASAFLASRGREQVDAPETRIFLGTFWSSVMMAVAESFASIETHA
jgi:hypothetical protein